MKHSVKEWFAVTRYWSFPVSTMPVVVTFAWIISKGLLPGGFTPWLVFILAVLGVVLLHSAGNVLSDWADHRTGVDNPDAFAVPNLVFGKFLPKEYLVFSCILFVLGIIDGIVIVLLSGTALLWIGGIGVLLTLGYSFLKYHALGDADIFVIFGILPVLGTAYAVTGQMQPEALVLSIPLGVITVSVLHANNCYDSVSDKAAGIKTFAMLIGVKASAILYCVYMVIPFVAIACAVITGQLHFLSLLCFVAAPIAYKNLRQAAQYKEKGKEAMAGLDLATARLQLIFSLSLAAGLFVSALV